MAVAFVNERPVSVSAGATVADAVRAFDSALADRLAAGEGRVTDGRGIDLPLDNPVHAGTILRAVISARRPAAEPDADA